MIEESKVNDNLVFDIGAHKGEDSDFYLKLGYQVVAVEANPTLAKELRQRFRNHIMNGSYVLIEKAIGDSNEEISFYVNRKLSIWGTTDLKWALRNKEMGAESEEIRVPCVNFASLINSYGCPRYLKIDIEGADMLCVHALSQFKCRPKYISFESTKTSWSDLKKEFDELERLGYSKFKVIDQQKHTSGTYMTRSGKPLYHTFEGGSSGPFGENLGGIWLSKTQAILRYVPIFLLYKTIGDNKVLGKIIAHLPILTRLVKLVSWYDTHAMRD
jgi:FkbM family methyltransferase